MTRYPRRLLKTILISQPLVIATLRALEDNDKASVHEMSPLRIHFYHIKAATNRNASTLVYTFGREIIPQFHIRNQHIEDKTQTQSVLFVV